MCFQCFRRFLMLRICGEYSVFTEEKPRLRNIKC
nr:MAG TPA: hypothetical protein [Caudoviricetes sp.]